MKSHGVTIQMKANEQYFHMALFIFKYRTQWNLGFVLNFDVRHPWEWKRVKQGRKARVRVWVPRPHLPTRSSVECPSWIISLDKKRYCTLLSLSKFYIIGYQKAVWQTYQIVGRWPCFKALTSTPGPNHWINNRINFNFGQQTVLHEDLDYVL